jgi:hypothetical protein
MFNNTKENYDDLPLVFRTYESSNLDAADKICSVCEGPKSKYARVCVKCACLTET